MADADPLSPREQSAEQRARALLGDDVRLRARTVATRAGPLSGILTYGYAVIRPAPGETPLDEWVLGISPPAGRPLDFAHLGSPEEAVADAVRRRDAGLPPLEGVARYRVPDGVGGADADGISVDRDWLPPGEFTTSSLTTSSLDLSPA